MGQEDSNIFDRQECLNAIWPEKNKWPAKNIACRHCQALNKVKIPQAALFPENCKCGKCGKALFLTASEPIRGLNSAHYEHPLDHNYLIALRSIPGFPLLVKWLLGHLTDRSNVLQQLADNVRCGEDQLPELVDLLNQAATRLDIKNIPALYLGESPFINAATSGIKQQIIVLKNALVDLLAPEEIKGVLGHELGHLQSEHLLYHLLAVFVINGGQYFSDLGRLLSAPLRLALLKWYRCSELTADRAALLASGSLPATLGMLIKMAGCPKQSGRYSLSLAPFIKQVRELATMQDNSLLDNTLAAILNMQRTHPQIAWRVMYLLDWVENGNYLNVLAAGYQPHE